MATAELVPTNQSADTALIAMIVTAAQDKSIELDRLQKLMEMRERILAHEAELAFNVAMNAAQSEISPVVKDGENPHAHSRYATLEKVDREIRPIYAKHGFSLTFNTGTPANPAAVHVICEVRHTGGHKKEYFLEGDLDVSGAQGKSNKTSIQGLGSSVSYLRRYLTLMIFNVTLTNEDNDGNGNREAHTAMRQAADTRQAAREAAERAVPNTSGLQPPHDQQLRDSLRAFPTNTAVIDMTNSRPTRKGGGLTRGQIDVANEFNPLHKGYIKLGLESRYRDILGAWGAVKSTEFDPAKEDWRGCLAEMKIDLQGLQKAREEGQQ